MDSDAPSTGFDPVLLRTASVPADLPLDRGRVHFLWQPPDDKLLDAISASAATTAVIAGRFDAEVALRERGLDYRMSPDFFPLRAHIDLEMSSIDARARWNGAPPPAYEGMPLIDGDITRLRVWNEMIAATATLLAIRQAAPDTVVHTDWMGAEIARACGLNVRLFRRAAWRDPQWPVRRWLRERITSAPARTIDPTTSTDVRPVDVVVLLGSWVEQRQVDSFPIRALAARDLRIALWVHQRTPAVEQLAREIDGDVVQIHWPAPARDVQPLSHNVSSWCDRAALQGFFAPVGGELAQRLIRLMGWPRWTPKLVAMHRLLTRRLQQARPRLVIAPAEKDWSSHCMHHAATRIGIPTVAVKHGTWLAGSALEPLNDAYYFPTGATHVLAFTPAEARDASDELIWNGNPRLCSKSDKTVSIDDTLLVATMGIGPGRAVMRWRYMLPLHVRFIEALHARIGERLRVRLHPWDKAENYPEHIRGTIIRENRPLEEEITRHRAVAAIYSTFALDAACAGWPVFVWDADGLDMDRTELAEHGGAVVSTRIEHICDAASRFFRDDTYREQIEARAQQFPRYVADRSNGDPDKMLADWLVDIALRRRAAGCAEHTSSTRPQAGLEAATSM